MARRNLPHLPPHIAAQEAIDLALATEELRVYHLRLERVTRTFASRDSVQNSTDPSLYLARLQVRHAERILENLRTHYAFLRIQYAETNAPDGNVSSGECPDNDFPIADDDPWFGNGIQHPVDMNEGLDVQAQGLSTTDDPTPPYTSLPGSPTVRAPEKDKQKDMPPKTPPPSPNTNRLEFGHIDGLVTPPRSQQAPGGPPLRGHDIFSTPTQEYTPNSSHLFFQPPVQYDRGRQVTSGLPTPGGSQPTAATPASPSPFSPSTPSRLNNDRPFLTSPFPSQRHYVVTRGRRTGIYSSWNEAQIYVNGVNGAVFQHFPTYDAALDTYFRLRTLGRVQVIRGSGDTDEEYGHPSTAEDI